MNIIWAVAGVLGWSAALYRDGDEDVDVHSRVVRRWRWLLCDAAVPGKKKLAALPCVRLRLASLVLRSHSWLSFFGQARWTEKTLVVICVSTHCRYS